MDISRNQLHNNSKGPSKASIKITNLRSPVLIDWEPFDFSQLCKKLLQNLRWMNAGTFLLSTLVSDSEGDWKRGASLSCYFCPLLSWESVADMHTPQELAAMNDCTDILRYLDGIASKQVITCIC